MNKPTALQNSLMLTPLIGATGSFASALGVWVMFIAVVSTYGAGMTLLRSRLDPTVHLVASILLAATLTSCAQSAGQAFALQWHQPMGIYAGLIALQCVVLERSGFFHNAMRDRLRLCLLFGALLLGSGALRAFLGSSELRLATLAPGGFILLGLLLAAWQASPRRTSRQ
ncbi:Rnf-Nqr domain containing protein [Pseudomonas sp. PB3P13]